MRTSKIPHWYHDAMMRVYMTQISMSYRHHGCHKGINIPHRYQGHKYMDKYIMGSQNRIPWDYTRKFEVWSTYMVILRMFLYDLSKLTSLNLIEPNPVDSDLFFFDKLYSGLIYVAIGNHYVTTICKLTKDIHYWTLANQSRDCLNFSFKIQNANCFIF